MSDSEHEPDVQEEEESLDTLLAALEKIRKVRQILKEENEVLKEKLKELRSECKNEEGLSEHGEPNPGPSNELDSTPPLRWLLVDSSENLDEQPGSSGINTLVPTDAAEASSSGTDTASHSTVPQKRTMSETQLEEEEESHDTAGTQEKMKKMD
ncbi:hypothetical protein ACJJTC_002419 [Scirpophaga incertulas]